VLLGRRFWRDDGRERQKPTPDSAYEHDPRSCEYLKDRTSSTPANAGLFSTQLRPTRFPMLCLPYITAPINPWRDFPVRCGLLASLDWPRPTGRRYPSCWCLRRISLSFCPRDLVVTPSPLPARSRTRSAGGIPSPADRSASGNLLWSVWLTRGASPRAGRVDTSSRSYRGCALKSTLLVKNHTCDNQWPDDEPQLVNPFISQHNTVRNRHQKKRKPTPARRAHIKGVSAGLTCAERSILRFRSLTKIAWPAPA